jgi:hypothetical protein
MSEMLRLSQKECFTQALLDATPYTSERKIQLGIDQAAICGRPVYQRDEERIGLEGKVVAFRNRSQHLCSFSRQYRKLSAIEFKTTTYSTTSPSA